MNRSMNPSTSRVVRISYVAVLVLILTLSVAGIVWAAAVETMP